MSNFKEIRVLTCEESGDRTLKMIAICKSCFTLQIKFIINYNQGINLTFVNT